MPPVCPLGEGLPPVQRAIRLGRHCLGQMGKPLSPISQDGAGCCLGHPRPLPTGSRCPRSDAGKCYPQALLIPPLQPETVLSSCGQGSGAPEWLAPPSYQDQSCPCCSRSWSETQCEGKAWPQEEV